VLETAPAVLTAAAVDEGHHGHAVALPHVRDLPTDGDHLGRELVSEDLRKVRAGERVRLDRGHDRSCQVLVQVGAADPAPARRHDDLCRERDGRLRHVFDLELSTGVEAEGPHRST
jgi:hypothetical protein